MFTANFNTVENLNFDLEKSWKNACEKIWKPCMQVCAGEVRPFDISVRLLTRGPYCPQLCHALTLLRFYQNP